MRLTSVALALAIAGTAAIATPAGAVVITASAVLVNTDIDEYFFTVTTAGQVDITVLNSDGLGAGPDFDSVINLYFDDGDLTIDDLVASDDDGAGNSQSALSLVLAAGDYLLRIGTHDFSPESLGPTNPDGHHIFTDYDLTITIGDDVVALPEPGVLGLMGLGLAGLGLVRRRRR